MAYVLITPARNESAFIAATIDGVTKQTVLPAQWVIVDDGSTDDTASIVRTYAGRYPFIRLVSLRHERDRTFSSKAVAFKAGVDALGQQYPYIGNLDADILLMPNYYETALASFESDPRIGIVGGSVHNLVKGRYINADKTGDSVAGAIQLFRRECFEQIGGYRGLPWGGIDAAAEITARYYGWRVCKVKVPTYEQRRTGTAQQTILRYRYRDGYKFHSLGYGMPFFFCRCLRGIVYPPYLIGSALSALGFAVARIKGMPISLQSDVVQYLRAEQRGKLRRAALLPMAAIVSRLTGNGRTASI
jgi:poly-beta-1,6-N-acetyl-D-glucosamine synthase